MQAFDRKQANIGTAMKAAAITIGLASTSLPALGQSKTNQNDNSAQTPIVAPMHPSTSSTVNLQKQEDAKQDTSNEHRKEIQKVSTDRNNAIDIFSAISGALALGAMGWYWKQIKNKETAVSLPTVTLQAVNDALLCTAAIITDQGGGAIATSALFALGGIACIHAASKVTGQRSTFDKWNSACAIGCGAGWLALISAWTPQATHYFGAEMLQIAGSWIGTATYIVAGIPIMREMLSKPKDEEIKVCEKNRNLQIFKTICPYIMGTIALGIAVATVPEYSLATAVQPVGLFINNILLNTCIAVWAARRVRLE